MAQPASPPTPQPAKPARQRPSAQEVRKNHAIYAAISVAMMIWFTRDGWFNQDPKMLEHVVFNRSGATITAVLSVFFVIMAISAHQTVQRQQPPKPSEPTQSS